MKLNPKAVRHLAPEDWRVLTAVELGSKNHEVVPTPTIEKNARLRGGARGVHRSISNLARIGLIAKVKESKYDGYRLTYGGLDYLALHYHQQKKNIYSVGSRIGVGKESDITMVADNDGVQKVLKIHRLGRISFRSVRTNRDYLRNSKTNGSGGWMYLSRLAAMKEFAFMTALRDEGFPVPEPIAQSRHTVLMSFIDAFPLRQVSDVPDPASLYADLIAMILRLAKHGLIHGDFNEFNLLIKEVEDSGENEAEETIKLVPIVIDFPQMVSMDHENAEMYFDRDVQCIKTFFERRFKFTSTEPGPLFKDAKKTLGQDGAKRLDAVAAASGFTKKMLKDLEAAIRDQQNNPEVYELGSEDEVDEEECLDEQEGEDVEGGDKGDKMPESDVSTENEGNKNVEQEKLEEDLSKLAVHT